MTHHQNILVCPHPLLPDSIWFCSVGGSHTQNLHMWLSFLMNSILLVALTRLSIPLASLPSPFPTYFHQVLLSPPINRVSIVYFPPCLLYMWKACGNLNRLLATRCCAAWVRKFFPNWCGERHKRCWTFWGAACVFSGFENLGYLLIFCKILINGIWFKLGDLEGCSLGGGVGADSCVCTFGGCKTGSTLGAGAGMLVISGG